MDRVRAYEHAQQRVFDRYRLDVEHRYLDTPSTGGRTHVASSGDGPPIVMVIGAGVAPPLWAPLMAELDGHTLHVVDLPGLGLTDPMPYETGTLRRSTVAFLTDVLDGLGLDRPAFVANSMGGLWSTWLALDRPARIGALVQVGCPAVLLSTSAPLPMRLVGRPLLGRLLMRLQPPSPRQAERFAVMAGEDIGGRPELRDLFVAFALLANTGPALRSIVGSAVGLRGARRSVRLTSEQLAGLTVPVRFVWGDRDPFGPPSVGREAARLAPRGDFQLVGGGHAPWLDDPAAVARQITDLVDADVPFPSPGLAEGR